MSIGRVWIDLGDCEVLDGGSAERGLVGPSYRVAVRGPVGEVAQVRVNDIDCGLAWAPPYRVEITDALRSGTNEIEIVRLQHGGKCPRRRRAHHAARSGK
jgi:hypothetical protein